MGERFWQGVLEDGTAGGVGSGFEDGPKTLAWVLVAHCLKSLGNGGGVMAEIIDDGDSAGCAADFLAALDAFEGGDGLLDGGKGDAVEVCGADGHGGVADIKFAGNLEFKRGIQ